MFETKEIAIAEWNRRSTSIPPSDDLRAAMEALREHDAMGWPERDFDQHNKLDSKVKAVLAAWDAQQGERS